MQRYFLEVGYKGTRYSGLQVQENAVTVQSEIEHALAVLHRVPFALTGSSRTDAGVHAVQNYFHFDAETVHPQLVYKMNALLPPDIVVRRVVAMPEGAHSRFDAIGRSYRYRIHRFKNPFLEGFSYFFPYTINEALLHEGAAYILEQENFFAFSKTNTQVRNFRCAITTCRWEVGEEEMVFMIEGNRFLRGMVRLLTATLLKLGREKLDLDSFRQLFEGEGKCGFSVPAVGLYLEKVRYPENYFPL